MGNPTTGKDICKQIQWCDGCAVFVLVEGYRTDVLNAYVYICVYVHKCEHMHIYVDTYVHTHMYMHILKNISVFLYLSTEEQKILFA